jgi:hypothetical protein
MLTSHLTDGISVEGFMYCLNCSSVKVPISANINKGLNSGQENLSGIPTIYASTGRCNCLILTPHADVVADFDAHSNFKYN